MDQERKIQEIEAERAFAKPRERRRPKIWAIILLMAVAWGLYGLELHYHHRLPQWILIILASGLAVGGLVYLTVCLKKGKVYFADQYGPGQWYSRGGDSFLYWLSMALLSLMTLGALYEALYLIFPSFI